MNSDETDRGICILSFDAGGPGTYSQLLMVKEYMSRLATDLGVEQDSLYPADYFDLMGGVGFGGIASIMLGHLRMTADQAVDSLLDVASAVFPDESDGKSTPEMNMKNLREAIKGILEAKAIPIETRMNDNTSTPTKCKVVIYAAAAANPSHPLLFRTYATRGSSLNPTIVDAICATMAAPTSFSSVKIGPRQRQQAFIGGPVGANNPTRELLKEAVTVFGKNTRVAQIVSLGAGRPRVMSSESVPSEVVAGEQVADELSTRLCNVDAYIRLNVNKGMEGLRMGDWNDLGGIESRTSCYVESLAISRTLEASIQLLRSRRGTATLGQINYSSNIKVPVKSVPAVSPYYVIRPKEYGIMVKSLTETPTARHTIFPITGMAGCGKTQLVSYFFQEEGSRYKYAIVVDATSLATLKADLQAWARARGDGHEQDVWEDAMRILQDDLDGKWVLILDNADNPSLNLTPFIPLCPNGTVIITSRNRDLGNLSTSTHLELGEMEEGEAVATLLRAARRTGPLSTEELSSAKSLVKELGYLAVALVQVGTYCHQLSSTINGDSRPYTFKQYTMLFSSQRAELMKRAAPHSLDNYQLGAYTAFDLSYAVMPQHAKNFIHFLSFFDPSSISIELFAVAAGYSFADPDPFMDRPGDHQDILADLNRMLCNNDTWSEPVVHETIRTLRSFSLVSASSILDTTFLQLHPLVHSWSRDMLKVNSQHYQSMALQTLTSCVTDANFQLYQYIIPHIRQMLDVFTADGIHPHDQYAAALILKDQAYYDNAEVLFIKVLLLLEHFSGRDSQLFLGVASQLVATYHVNGKLNHAEALGRELVERYGRVVGREHQRTIVAAENLAILYGDQGRYDASHVQLVEVLEQQKRLLGMDHPHTMRAAVNLASNYCYQGQFHDAAKLQLEVLERRERILGKEHLDTVRLAGTLAATYSQLGNWSEAEKLCLETLAVRKRLLGKEHPDTITSMETLASTYCYQRRYKEAEEIQLAALEQRRRRMGMEHPLTVWAMAQLARTYNACSRYRDAEELQLEVLKQRKRASGKDHPKVLEATGDLAATYSNQGRFDEAVYLIQEVLESRTRVLGSEHPGTIESVYNLAINYLRQEEWEKAASLLFRVVGNSFKVLGKDHPGTHAGVSNLAWALGKLGMSDEAQDIMDMLS